MADPSRSPVRPLLLAGGGLVLLVLLAIARGPVALLAAASVAVLAGIVMAVPPLMGHDGIDWDWLPDRAVEIPPEPGIANLRRLLAPGATDTAAPAQLHQLVRAIAVDRASNGAYGRGRLASYLDGPPRPLDLTEADALITELEALPIQET
ncbi:MAG TPA: hypothetical protein VES93_05280 [Ornithinibacter sp.]|nr:hypothetical protein [Ornithinibacter sp.]